MVTEGGSTWGGEHTMQYTDKFQVYNIQNCMPKTYIILLTSYPNKLNYIKSN